MGTTRSLIVNCLIPHPKKSNTMLIFNTDAMGPVASMHIGTDAIEWVNKSH